MLKYGGFAPKPPQGVAPLDPGETPEDVVSPDKLEKIDSFLFSLRTGYGGRLREDAAIPQPATFLILSVGNWILN